MTLDFTRCRKVWVPTDEGGFWSPPPPHVEYGVRWIIANPYALLGDDMGGMKTAQAIISAQFLHDAGEIDRVIVVAPASVRPKVWFDEDLGQLREQVFDDKNNRVTEFHAKVRSWRHGPTDAPELRWIVTNYEFIRGAALKVLLPYCGPKTMLILDESSAVRSWDSAQTKACMSLRWLHNKRGKPVHGAARCGRILELNGTPIAETPQDAFSQANLMHPSILGCRYITQFKSRYAVQEPVMERGKPMRRYGRVVQSVAGWTNIDDLTRRMAPYILRREAKEFGVDFALPPVGLEVRLTDRTWKAYVEMRREMVVWLKSSVATASTAAVKSLRLSQITSGFVGGLLDDGAEYTGGDVLDLPGSFLDGLALRDDGAKALNEQRRQLNSSIIEVGREKLDFVLNWHAEMLKRHPDLKLLLWCRFVPELKRLLREERLTFPSIPVGAACGQKALEGEQSQKTEREFALRLLHPKTAPPGPATVGATAGTGALGLNFTACRTVMDVSYDFSSFKKKQGDARVNRTGQTGPVNFFYLIAVGPRGQKTIDHHVMLTRLGKMQVADWTTAQWVRALESE